MESKWIKFSFLSSNDKTKVWEVLNIDKLAFLGTVKWFGRWRQYAFFPAVGTTFEKQCLRDIALFCENQTGDHRNANKMSKQKLPKQHQSPRRTA